MIFGFNLQPHFLLFLKAPLSVKYEYLKVVNIIIPSNHSPLLFLLLGQSFEIKKKFIHVQPILFRHFFLMDSFGRHFHSQSFSCWLISRGKYYSWGHNNKGDIHSFKNRQNPIFLKNFFEMKDNVLMDTIKLQYSG